MHTLGGKDVFQVKTAGKMAFESQIEAGRHSVTINSGGHPDNMIHFEGTSSGARLDIHVQTDMHLQAGSNITLEAKSINLTATDQIQITSEKGSVGTQAENNIIEQTLKGKISSTAKTNVGIYAQTENVAVTADTGAMSLTGNKGVTVEGGPNIVIHADHIGLND